MSDRRILCVGMCVLDIMYKYSTYPLEDTKLRCTEGYWARGGNASNNCTVLDKLGATCEFFGFVTDSPKFSFLMDDFHKRSIIIENCPTTTMYPPFSSIVITNEGTRTIFHCPVPEYPRVQYEHFERLPLNHYKWIHFEGRQLSPTLQMIEKVKDYNGGQSTPIVISVELEKYRESEDLVRLVVNVDVVFISKDLALYKGWVSAAEAVYGMRKGIQNLRNNLLKQTKAQETPLPHVICPWGDRGADCLSSTGEYSSHAARIVPIEKIKDSCGAGDTFIAAFMHAYGNLQKTLKESVDYGNKVAAFKIQQQGYDDIHADI